MPIGIFDSGYGGLSIFSAIKNYLPDYDFLYLGDNARAPYGTRSFEVVYEYTRQATLELFSRNCPLVILACNTASAKALRTIQQCDLPQWNFPGNRVLGIIRPTVEALGTISQTSHVGIFATSGTVSSHSYALEINKLFPQITLTEEACPMWVPLVENNEIETPACEYFVKRHVEAILSRDPQIDTLVLACTHYSLLFQTIKRYTPPHIKLFTQGNCVAKSLKTYLSRHPEIEIRLSRKKNIKFLSSENPEKFNSLASQFLKTPIQAEQISF